MYKSHITGKTGETEAEKYLRKQGYVILDRNFLCKKGEIDIVALDKKELVFIEVKTRKNDKYGMPSEAVTKKKIEHIYKAAEFYIHVRNLKEMDARIDVIEIYYFEKEKFKINHIKQII